MSNARMSPEQVMAHRMKFEPRSKYGAKRVSVDGYGFDSKAEAKRYGILKLMLAAGLISDLQVHPRYGIKYGRHEICVVELDFVYTKRDEDVPTYEDVKGMDNPLSKLKRKLVEAFYSIHVEVVKK
jgi:hypothetical protein